MGNTERHEQFEIDASLARERAGSGRWGRQVITFAQTRLRTQEQVGAQAVEKMVTVEGITELEGGEDL